MTIDCRRVKSGAYLFQLFLPARHAKLAVNKSHYLVMDEVANHELEVGGRVRECKILVKVWVPIPRKDRADEGIRSSATKRLKWHSPMLK